MTNEVFQGQASLTLPRFLHLLSGGPEAEALLPAPLAPASSEEGGPGPLAPGTCLADLLRFPLGARVMAQWRGRGAWFPGRVSSLTPEGATTTYGVQYDDGDRDEGLRWEALRAPVGPEVALLAPTTTPLVPSGAAGTPPGLPPHQQGPALAVGTRVTAQWQGRTLWFPGRVSAVGADGAGGPLYDILYDDGDREVGVLPVRVRAVLPGEGAVGAGAGAAGEAPAVDTSPPHAQSLLALGLVLEEGARVLARWHGRGLWFPGRVTAAVGEGSARVYSVQYDDGDRDPALGPGSLQVLE